MIAVYGANGFIGRSLMRRLVAENKNIRAISRHFDQSFIDEFRDHAQIIESDFSNNLTMVDTLQGVEEVVQLISTSSPGFGNRYLIDDIEDNIIPHVRFMQNCVEMGIRRYIFISSGGTVYGPTTHIPIPETHQTNPINSHGLSKLVVEKYLGLYSKTDGLECVILRLANAYGPGQILRKGQGLIPAILGRYKKGLPIDIYGDGSALRDYVYIDDVVGAISLAITTPGARNEILNIGSGIGRSVIDIIEAIENLLNIKLERHYISKRDSDVDANVLDVSRAKPVLGWVPMTSFQDGLKATLSEQGYKL